MLEAQNSEGIANGKLAGNSSVASQNRMEGQVNR